MTQQQLTEKYASLPAEAQQRIDEFMATLSLKYQEGLGNQQSETPIEDEGFVGMWRDAPHLEDSSAWVRSAREKHWGQK